MIPLAVQESIGCIHIKCLHTVHFIKVTDTVRVLLKKSNIL